MSTHGDIEIFNSDGTGLRYWLHAYHDGHTEQAFRELVELPQWLADRAELQYEITEDSIEKRDKVGHVGAGILLMSRGVGDWRFETDEDFASAWRSYLGTNQNYCDSSRIAGLMVQRNFERWTIIAPDDAPWRSPNAPPDISVECDPEGYRVSTGETSERVDFPEQVFLAFRKLVMGKK